MTRLEQSENRLVRIGVRGKGAGEVFKASVSWNSTFNLPSLLVACGSFKAELDPKGEAPLVCTLLPSSATFGTFWGESVPGFAVAI